MSSTTATAYAAPTLHSRVRLTGRIAANGWFEVITLGGGTGGWAAAGKRISVARDLLRDIDGPLPTPNQPVAAPAAAELPETWYALLGSTEAHYATNTLQDEQDGVVRPICGGIPAATGSEVRESAETDTDCPACAEELGDYYLPRPAAPAAVSVYAARRNEEENRPGRNEAARRRAYLALAALASKMSEARERADQVALADLRTSMNDQRAALALALATPLECLSRDGYAHLTPAACRAFEQR